MLKDNLLILGLLLAGLVTTYAWIWRRQRFFRGGVRTRGTVAALSTEERHVQGGYGEGSSSTETLYFPHVSFSLEDGSAISFRGVADFKPTYHVGESVPVVYDPQFPSTTGEIDTLKGDFPAAAAAIWATALFAAAVAWILIGPSC